MCRVKPSQISFPGYPFRFGIYENLSLEINPSLHELKMDWELEFMDWASGWWTSPVLDQVIPWMTYLGSHFAVALFIILTWILTRRKKKILASLVLLYGVQSAVIYGVKYLMGRQRPFCFLEGGSKSFRGHELVLDPGFPSAHSALSFMMATLLSVWFPRYRVLFFLLAGFIGWTRIYLYLHYPTDVIAGALLGYGITVYLWTISGRKVS